jgi:phage terminase large subunit-like protein
MALLPEGLEMEDILALPLVQRREAFELLNRKRQIIGGRLFYELWPDEDTLWEGPEACNIQTGETLYARGKYAKHLEFFWAGSEFRERAFRAANRVSKTVRGGGYETACHLTGLYPDWWNGRRFDHPVAAWACGKTNETSRDIVQATLLGSVVSGGQRKAVSGTGIIPNDLIGEPEFTRVIGNPSWKAGVQDLVDQIPILHVSGEYSHLGIKAYQQGRDAFEGTARHVIWGDEEPPMDIYGEMLIRTGTTDGILMLTFTPLLGQSEVVRSFENTLII